jgi:hypothetical protein
MNKRELRRQKEQRIGKTKKKILMFGVPTAAKVTVDPTDVK